MFQFIRIRKLVVILTLTAAVILALLLAASLSVFTPYAVHMQRGHKAYSAKQFTTAESQFQAAARKAERARHDRQLGDSLFWLAKTYQMQVGSAEEPPTAREVWQRLKRSCRPGGENPIAAARDSLERRHYARNEGKDLPTFRRAVAAYQRGYAKNDPLLADKLCAIAGLVNFYDARDFTGRLYRQALTIRADALGIDHAKTLDVFDSLFTAYWSWSGSVEPPGLRDEQKTVLLDYVRLWERRPGTNPCALTAALDGLGEIALDEHDYSAAEGYWRRCIEVQSPLTLYDNNRFRSWTWNCEQVKQLPIAERLAAYALSRESRRSDQWTYETGEAYAVLADVYVCQKRYQEAERFYRHAIAIADRMAKRDTIADLKQGRGSKSTVVYLWDILGGRYCALLEATGRKSEAAQIGQMLD